MSSSKGKTSSPKTLDDLLSHITQFGKRAGIKRVRVKLKDMEAEVEFPGEDMHAPNLSHRHTPSPKEALSPPPEGNSLESYENNPKYKIIKSPLVGTFYRSPSPNTDPFVEVGSRIEKGKTLAIIEAMKLMNELESEHSGIIEKILIENGTPVEYDQPLFVLTV